MEHVVGRRLYAPWIALAVLPFSVLFTPAIAAEEIVAPIQAELVQRLEANNVKLGDSVLARVQLGWKSSFCELLPGDILQGRVVFQKPYAKSEKTSEVAFVFEKAPCGGPVMKPLALVVAAIVS